jgi:hypothetical protein
MIAVPFDSDIMPLTAQTGLCKVTSTVPKKLMEAIDSVRLTTGLDLYRHVPATWLAGQSGLAQLWDHDMRYPDRLCNAARKKKA